MLKELFAEAAGAVFEAADDVPQAVFLRRVTPGVYNPATGKTSPATTVDHPCQGIIGTYKQIELSGTSILATDRRVTIRQAEVVAAGTITTTDKVVIGGTAKTIINVGQDAAGVLWVLQVR